MCLCGFWLQIILTDFKEPCLGVVEKWLLEFEGQMKQTLHKLAGESLLAYTQTERSRWLLEWPGQLVLNISQVVTQSSKLNLELLLFLAKCQASFVHSVGCHFFISAVPFNRYSGQKKQQKLYLLEDQKL